MEAFGDLVGFFEENFFDLRVGGGFLEGLLEESEPGLEMVCFYVGEFLVFGDGLTCECICF